MADLDSSWVLGEFRGEVETKEVQYANGIEAGDFLTITGINADGQFIVSKQTLKTECTFICPFGADGVEGDIREVLFRGYIKTTFGAAVTTGLKFGVNANKAVIVAADIPAKGFSASPTAADGDTGVVYFNGGNV